MNHLHYSEKRVPLLAMGLYKAVTDCDVPVALMFTRNFAVFFYIIIDSLSASMNAREDGCCWVCQSVTDNHEEFFYPCHCKLHRSCIKQWVAKVGKHCANFYLYCVLCYEGWFVS